MPKYRKTSKRICLKDKYKIQKRVVENGRKQRKNAKKDAKNGIKKHKKRDPGIPNSWPFKQQLLQQIESEKAREEMLSQKRKEKKGAKSMEELMNQANQSNADFNAKQNILPSLSTSGDVKSDNTPGQSSRRAYLAILKSLISSSDVILQILDARDPLGTRAPPQVEDLILSNTDKKMVFVLNKIDLIPKTAVQGWLNYLRQFHPTLALKTGLSHAMGDKALESSSAVGIESLMGLLKNYARVRNSKAKTCISVGVMGYPNVGKSSLINSLKRTRAVGVSPTPGYTTSMQEVVLDRNVRLMDSPGVVFADGDDAMVLLRNCVSVDQMEDPIRAIGELVKRCKKETLMMKYAIPFFPEGNVEMFLSMVGKKLGIIGKGGIVNKEKVARRVLVDWNTGEISYFTPPPAMDAGNKGDVQIVTQFGKEFDLGDQELMKVLDKTGKDEMDFVHLNPAVAGKDISMEEEMEDDDEEEDSDDEMDDNQKMADADDYEFES